MIDLYVPDLAESRGTKSQTKLAEVVGSRHIVFDALDVEGDVGRQ